MNDQPPFERHEIFPNYVYKDIVVPPFCTPERYAALHTKAFTPRMDDIVVSTFAKSGTTWLQNILYYLVGCPNGPIVRLNETVPWLQGESVKLDHIEKMKSPRVFKTHDYWSWMPKKLRETARFIYCSRNPKDQVVSYFHHMKTLKSFYGDKCAEMTFDEYFSQIYIKKDVTEFGLWEDHNIEWLEQSLRKNILYLTYEDLKENTEREIRKIAEFLSLSVSEECIANTLKKSGFKHMQNSENVNYSWLTGLKSGFLRKGEVGGWVEYLNEEQSAYFENPIQRVIQAGGHVRCNL